MVAGPVMVQEDETFEETATVPRAQVGIVCAGTIEPEPADTIHREASTVTPVPAAPPGDP